MRTQNKISGLLEGFTNIDSFFVRFGPVVDDLNKILFKNVTVGDKRP